MRLECETSFYNDEKLDDDLTHAQETADEALEQAEQAAGTATNYLYDSVEKGLVVSRTKVETDTEVEALTTPNSRVTSSGFDVYKDGETRVAHFGGNNRAWFKRKTATGHRQHIIKIYIRARHNKNDSRKRHCWRRYERPVIRNDSGWLCCE